MTKDIVNPDTILDAQGNPMRFNWFYYARGKDINSTKDSFIDYITQDRRYPLIREGDIRGLDTIPEITFAIREAKKMYPLSEEDVRKRIDVMRNAAKEFDSTYLKQRADLLEQRLNTLLGTKLS